MARLPRVSPPGVPQHVIQRGNNRQVCFVADADFAAYAQWLHEAACSHSVAIHAWVFMTNHVHLLATPQVTDGLSRMMQALGRRYVRYFNRAYRRTGTLWEGRFRSCLVEADDYLLTCQRYIELNPVRAGMVSHPAEYRWSSFHANGLGVSARLWTPHEIYLRLGANPPERQLAYRELFRASLDNADVTDIRTAVHKGLALGNQRFRSEIEQLTGRRQTAGRPGPRPKGEQGG